MSDFFTVMVSNDEGVSLGISTPHDISPATVPSIKVHLIDFVFMFMMLFKIYDAYICSDVYEFRGVNGYKTLTIKMLATRMIKFIGKPIRIKSLKR